MFKTNFNPHRMRIGRLGLLPSLIRMMLADSQGGNIAWALVYQISLDDRGRILISRSECFSFVLEYLLRCKETPLPCIPLALAVNLAHVPKLATELTQSKHFPLFLESAVAAQDAVLVKLLRNATAHAMSSQSSGQLAMAKIADAILRCSSDDYFQSEALGLLANMGEFSLPTSWPECLVKDGKLLGWINAQLKSGASPLDVQLAAVLVLRSMAAAPEPISGRLLDSGLMATLLNLLRSQQEDDEFVLQILHVFYRLLRNPETRTALLEQHDDVAASFLDLMTDQNVEVRKVCERGLVMIAEADAKWSERIKNERFCWHNAQWLEAVAKTNNLLAGIKMQSFRIFKTILQMFLFNRRR